MKKQQARRIVLGRETLRQLNGGDLAPAGGSQVTLNCLHTGGGCGVQMTSFACYPYTQGSICL